MVDERVGFLCGSAKRFKKVWSDNFLSTEKVLDLLNDDYKIGLTDISHKIEDATKHIRKNLGKFRETPEELRKHTSITSLKHMNMNKLRYLAKAYKVKGYSNKNKLELVKLIAKELKIKN
jgi:hypothetical protein